MFNPSVNLGPSLHFCNKISKYIKYSFLNFEIKYNSACRQTNDQITESCRAVSVLLWQLIWDTMPKTY